MKVTLYNNAFMLVSYYEWTCIVNLQTHFDSNATQSLVFIAFQEEVNITCINGAIRLADGLTEYEGRVEICYDNHWGGVCGNSWDSREATVVCRQLGHITAGEYSAHGNQHRYRMW